MGSLPSRESNEDPSSVFFANCGSHVVFHIPMTDHYFPSPQSLAFRQLFHARNNQSALYCFDMKDVSSVMPEDVAAAFREAQEEDWGAEVDEVDPSLHYYDDEIREKVLECCKNADSICEDAGAAVPRAPRIGRHLRPSIEDREELYRVLVTEPMEGTLVDTDAEMCALFEQEQRWRADLPNLFNGPQQEGSHSGKRCKANGGHGADENDTDHAHSSAGANVTKQQSHNKAVKRGHGAAAANGAGVDAAATHSPSVAGSAMPSALPPPPPAKFLYPIPRAIAVRLTTEEEEEMRAEYCRQRRIPYVAPAFHSVSTATGNRADACAGGFSAQQQHLAPRTPLPVVERRHYHFEDHPHYRDGRVHLVEEHGVLYHFAYFAKRQPQTATAVAAAAVDSSRGPQKAVTTGDAAPSGVLAASKTPTVRGRCLHDVVYCEKPSASPASSSKHAVASSLGFGGSEPEVAPPVRYTWCARCGECVTQRMDYTQLRRLKSTRVHRRAVQKRLPDSDQDSPRKRDSVDEVDSNTERVDEEGEEEFIINIMPVRVVGMDGLLPSRSRGTPWLRRYEQESEAAEDAYIEQLEQKPPVMRVCRFIEGSVGDKIVNRAALVTLLSYRPMCRQAGLSDALTRPIWSMCVLSNIPYLQMVRETFFRAKAAVAEVDDDDLLLRDWLGIVDRENNFYNFINANLHMTRNYAPPERTVRQREQAEQTDGVARAGTASSRRTTTGGGGGVREDSSVGIGPPGSSSVTSPSLLKTDVYSAVEDYSNPAASHAVHSATSASGDATSPSRRGAAPTAVVAARESAETAGQTTDAVAQGVCGKREDKDSDLKPAERDGADLRSRHLTRALEEATVGRPEGHDPRDQAEEDEDDEDDAEDEGRERGASAGAGESDAAVKTTVRREKGKKKLQHKDLGLSSLCLDTPSPLASSTDQCAADSAAASTSPFTEDTKQTRGDGQGNPVAASGMGGLPAAVDSRYGAHRHRSGGNEDGEDEPGGEPPVTTTTTSRTLPNAASARAVPGLGKSGEGDAMTSCADNFDNDDDPDLRTEEEERRRARVSVARTSETSVSSHQQPTAPSTVAEEARSAEKQSHQQRPEVPPRPNFQLFSSRLEPHAPLSLYKLFDYDASADQAAKRTVTQLAAAVAAGVAADHKNSVGSRDEDGADQATAASAAPEVATTAWPSYVQRDILRENERQQAEPKATRRLSHALYECGMLATTRGRNFLFLLREDCVRALLFYCSAAAAPIFIGAYIEPVDTTSLSYGGAVRLRRPSTVDIALDGSDEDDGSCAAPARNYVGQRVVIGQVEGMEVMAEYFKSKGLITCFSVSDVDKAAPGPSAAHRLRKMILPTIPLSTSHAQHRSSGGPTGEASSLAAQQARELAQYGHVFTYAAADFCDGDLVVFNFEERRWEHYEHLQLRRRFAAKAVTSAAEAVATPASQMPVKTAEPTSTGNVVVAADGNQSNANSVMDPSMSARLLCVGLDELLLSWTKWIVDNRFYEDRTDLGWLSLPNGSPIQLGGRYFLWSFRHNYQRYFYGVIPKFAKGRLRRHKMIERNRSKKKDAEAPRQQAQPLAGILAVSPASAQRSSDVSLGRSAPSSPVLATAVAATPSSPVRPSYKSPWQTSDTLEAQQEEEPRRRGGNTGTDSLLADLALGDQASSSPPHPGLGVSPSVHAGTTQKPPLPQEQLSTSAAAQAVSTAAAISTHPASMHQRQRRSSPHLQTQQLIAATSAPLPLPHRMNPFYSDSISYSAPDANITLLQQTMPQGANNNVAASNLSAAPATAGEKAQQSNFASSLNSAGGFSMHVGSNAARPTLCPPKISTESLSTTETTTTTAARRAPFLNPPPQHPLRGSRNHLSKPSSPAIYSSGQQIGFGGGPNYYYQYGGNTFIQDGKRHENEYYPPLPTSTPFHSVTAITKLAPLPHPKTGRGGIPAIFRFWGPIGSPAPRTPVAASSLPNAGGAAATASVAAIPISLVPQQIHPLSPRHPATDSPSASSSVGGGESMGGSLVEAHHHSTGSSLGAGSLTAPAIAPAGASAVNLTVHVRRRTGGGNTAAIRVGGGASLAPLQLPSQGTSSLGASLTTLTTTGPAMGPGTPFKHSPLTPSNRPTTPLLAHSAPAQLLAYDSGSQRLSPTSMLPTNLINEGSKTKGESVLRVDEDIYMQREAFRWNPYASTKWAQNRSYSTDGSTSDARDNPPVEGGSGSS